MAQLYKMTLYVCDLEGNMDIGELKAHIEDMALNGCWINCVSHFADEKAGPTVKDRNETYRRCSSYGIRCERGNRFLGLL